MLLRVAQSASRFPLHIVAIYTSTGDRSCHETGFHLLRRFILFFSCLLFLTFYSPLTFLHLTSHSHCPQFTSLLFHDLSFPIHSTPLPSLHLSRTVVECQRAGLKSSAYNYAVMLMSPDYRQHIDATIKKKIEAVVRRKSQQEEEASEELSLCPISKCVLHLNLIFSI